MIDILFVRSRIYFEIIVNCCSTKCVNYIPNYFCKKCLNYLITDAMCLNLIGVLH